MNSYGEYTKVGDIYLCSITSGSVIWPGNAVQEYSGNTFLFRVEEDSIALYSNLDLSEDPTILNINKLSRPANLNDPYGFFIASSQRDDLGEILKFNYGNLAYTYLGASNSNSNLMISYIAECEVI